MKLSKLSKGALNFSKNGRKFLNIFILLGIVVLVGVLIKYNGQKLTLSDGMRGSNPFSGSSVVNAPPPEENAANVNGNTPPVEMGVKPVSTVDHARQFLSVKGMESKKPTNTCNNKPVMDPKELLPTDNNNEWSNIMPNNDLKNVGMLNAGHHFGINTVGSSLRNANLQVRSEPTIPQGNVGPWNNTTIEADNLRRHLDIGGSE